MKTGCYTALVTPFTSNGALDGEGLGQLIEFQINNGITGILAAGTTGESPTLKWEEHLNIISNVIKVSKEKCLCIAGAGSNNTKEAMGAVAHSAELGVDAVLMVDPYYNGPSSLEIRKEYLEPVAKAFPALEIIPYIVPGRTGAQLLPEDLAILAGEYKNVSCVKEATGDLKIMRRVRDYCGEDFKIFSGDDGLVAQIMSDPGIKSCGSFSVLSNIVPGPLVEMIMLLDRGNIVAAKKINQALAPLWGLVTVNTREVTPYGEVVCRARNPLALKSLMQILGVPSGPCRKPLGKMTEKGIGVVVDAAKTVQEKNPEILKPLADFFGIDVWDRLNNPEYQKNLWYDY